MSDTAKRILVLCTGNRCRSQMAEGWLRHFAGPSVEVVSAGTKPKGVHPLAIQVMQESGVDISMHTSDHVDKYIDMPIDVAVTVCDNAREACPTFPNAKRMVHRSFEDPDQEGLEHEELLKVFHRIRDEIRDWAEQFVKEL